MKLKNENVSKALEILVTYAKNEDDWDLITDAVMDYYQEGYNFDLNEKRIKETKRRGKNERNATSKQHDRKPVGKNTSKTSDNNNRRNRKSNFKKNRKHRKKRNNLKGKKH